MINTRNPHWLAAYTKPRNEKKVLERLQNEEVEVYLPLQKRLKQWSDRKKWIEEPLLRSYIFVKVTDKEYSKVLQVNGVVRYVTFEGKPVPIPENQIDILRLLLGEQVEIEAVNENIEPGELVEVIAGQLSGLKGELVKHNGKKKVVIRIDHISHLLLVTLPKGFVVKSN
jgi:transcription antitermination factor NusG